MPVYIFSHQCGTEMVEEQTFTEVRPMSQHADPAYCPNCGAEGRRRYDLEKPIVFNHALADGTRRFSGLRTQIELERAKKAEKDKKRRSKLDADIAKVKGAS